MTPAPNICLMIMAAGEGTRTGLPLPKQYYGDPSPLAKVLQRFHDRFPMIVVHGAQHEAWIGPLRAVYPDSWFCLGGETRNASVAAGLAFMQAHALPYTHVLIHDAARPFAEDMIFDRVKTALLQGHNAVCPALPVSDTICQIDDETAMTWQTTPPRSYLRRIQTPQGFCVAALRDAFAKTEGVSFTDEGSLLHAAGYDVHLVEGSEKNMKMTTQDDMRDNPLTPSPARWITGLGFDVHAFDPSKKTITLCGLCLPANRGLSGHSDADVALHALTDALLGTMALGDIGDHFPPTDEAWRGADSAVFLNFALKQLTQRGGVLEHIDLTIIGEYPKIGSNRDRYRERLSHLTALPLSAISVKATTTEKLGFLGRQEGLAAQAVVSVRFFHTS